MSDWTVQAVAIDSMAVSMDSFLEVRCGELELDPQTKQVEQSPHHHARSWTNLRPQAWPIFQHIPNLLTLHLIGLKHPGKPGKAHRPTSKSNPMALPQQNDKTATTCLFKAPPGLHLLKPRDLWDLWQGGEEDTTKSKKNAICFVQSWILVSFFFM